MKDTHRFRREEKEERKWNWSVERRSPIDMPDREEKTGRRRTRRRGRGACTPGTRCRSRLEKLGVGGRNVAANFIVLYVLPELIKQAGCGRRRVWTEEDDRHKHRQKKNCLPPSFSF